MPKTYITTAIPYVNGAPHIGHAMDYCLADVFARYRRLCGDDVRFQAGVDEHGNKIYQKAATLGIPIQQYVDENTAKFQSFIAKLNVSTTDFIRTTDPEHECRCQEIWQRLTPHIYKAKYQGWYCDGCERFITEKEYTEHHGICPDHQKPYQKLEEENYYFRITDFKDQIHRAIIQNQMLILPEFRQKEILKLLADSPDVSISRSTDQLTWGIPVPGDNSQVMYVWLDALSNYITALGYPDQDISKWWPAAAQFVGKDILRFHAIIWPAMLLGLGLPLPKVLLSHGFILANGQKMSKSIGNVVDPVEVIDKYGTDAFRYYFLRHADTFLDSDFTWEKYDEAYNHELANDLGNLVQRLATLAHKNQVVLTHIPKLTFDQTYQNLMNKYEFSHAFDYIWGQIQTLNKRIDEEKPWTMAKNGQTTKLHKCLTDLIISLLKISHALKPFIPTTADKITKLFVANQTINPPVTPLFPKN